MRTEPRTMARFVLTAKGKAIHIAEAGAAATRCGWPVVVEADADDVLWFGVCERCRRDRDRW